MAKYNKSYHLKYQEEESAQWVSNGYGLSTIHDKNSDIIIK